MSEQKNIYFFDDHEGERLSAEQLRAYLEGRLSPDEQHKVEQWLSEEGMENDALEGLGSVSADEISESVTRIELRLRKKISVKRRNAATFYQEHFWLIVAVLLILLLCVLAYLVIHFSGKY